MAQSLPIATHIFFINNDRIFLMRRANTGFRDGEWSVPAGRLDPDETITAATIREASEEVGAEILPENLSSPLVMHHKDERGQRLYFFFICTKWGGELRNLESDKCSEVGWFDFSAPPSPMIPHIKEAFEKMRAGTTYSEYGFA
ncbi:MAG: NUDIX domain-containing protein [Patescibacteria group bacterium]